MGVRTLGVSMFVAGCLVLSAAPSPQGAFAATNAKFEKNSKTGKAVIDEKKKAKKAKKATKAKKAKKAKAKVSEVGIRAAAPAIQAKARDGSLTKRCEREATKKLPPSAECKLSRVSDGAALGMGVAASAVTKPALPIPPKKQNTQPATTEDIEKLRRTIEELKQAISK